MRHLPTAAGLPPSEELEEIRMMPPRRRPRWPALFAAACVPPTVDRECPAAYPPTFPLPPHHHPIHQSVLPACLCHQYWLARHCMPSPVPPARGCASCCKPAAALLYLLMRQTNSSSSWAAWWWAPATGRCSCVRGGGLVTAMAATGSSSQQRWRVVGGDGGQQECGKTKKAAGERGPKRGCGRPGGAHRRARRMGPLLNAQLTRTTCNRERWDGMGGWARTLPPAAPPGRRARPDLHPFVRAILPPPHTASRCCWYCTTNLREQLLAVHAVDGRLQAGSQMKLHSG